MTLGPFHSFAQNGEDVVLWRALGHIENGRYIDVGANHPTDDSVTRAFYNHGWRGIAVEPVPNFADLYRSERPEDLLVQSVVTDHGGDTVTLHEVPGTGLSTLIDRFRDQHEDKGREVHDIEVTTRTLDEVLEEAGWEGEDIHFVSIDTEGSEAAVLAGFDLPRWRPWVLAIEATAPDSVEETYEAWETAVTAAGYTFCLFDGLSRFYVDEAHRAELQPQLSHGANILDNYSTLARRRLDAELAGLRTELQRAADDVIHWRSAALTRWTDAITKAAPIDSAEAEHLRRELMALRETVSWRVTKPLRSVRLRVDSIRSPR